MSPKRRNAKEERRIEETQRAMELFSSWSGDFDTRGSGGRSGRGATGAAGSTGATAGSGASTGGDRATGANSTGDAASFDMPQARSFEIPTSRRDLKKAGKAGKADAKAAKESRAERRKKDRDAARKIQEHKSRGSFLDKLNEVTPVQAGEAEPEQDAEKLLDGAAAEEQKVASAETAPQAALSVGSEDTVSLSAEPGSPASTSAGFLDNLGDVMSLATDEEHAKDAEVGTAVPAADETSGDESASESAGESDDIHTVDTAHLDLSGLDVATGIYSLDDPQVVFDTDEEDDEDFDENAASILENAPDATFLPAPNFTTPEGATTEAGTPPGVRKKKRRVRPATVVKVILGVLLAAVVALCVYVGVSFQQFRWNTYDDATDFIGSWVVDGTGFFVVFTEDHIILSEDVAYEYTVDPQEKIIEITFGSMTGNDYYRFSYDRSQLLLIDNVEEGNGLITADFWWYVRMRIQELNPDFEVEFNDVAASLVLTRIPGTSPKDRPQTADFLQPGNDSGVAETGEGEAGSESGESEGEGSGQGSDIPEGESAADAVLNLPSSDDASGSQGEGASGGDESGTNRSPIGIDNAHG